MMNTFIACKSTLKKKEIIMEMDGMIHPKVNEAAKKHEPHE